jgi:hypothetical protein
MISDWTAEKRLYVDQIRAVLQFHRNEESQGQTIEQIHQSAPHLHLAKTQEALNTMVQEGIAVQNNYYKLTNDINLLEIMPSGQARPEIRALITKRDLEHLNGFDKMVGQLSSLPQTWSIELMFGPDALPEVRRILKTQGSVREEKSGQTTLIRLEFLVGSQPIKK